MKLIIKQDCLDTLICLPNTKKIFSIRFLKEDKYEEVYEHFPNLFEIEIEKKKFKAIKTKKENDNVE